MIRNRASDREMLSAYDMVGARVICGDVVVAAFFVTVIEIASLFLLYSPTILLFANYHEFNHL